jgi:AcrR family transcriptional regulator
MTLEERLELWIIARCHEQNPRPQRVAELNAIFCSIYSDRRFWRYRNDANRHDYEDALSRMWQYFIQNLCETTTARKSGSFLETRVYAVGRLLNNLEGQLKNSQQRRRREVVRRQEARINSDGVVIDPVDQLPNPEPEIPSRQFETFLKLLEQDQAGELNDPANTLRGTTKTTQEPYALTAQTYLLMRRRDEMTIQQIADKIDIPHGSLQGGAKPTKWKALERKFAQMAMDSVSE